MKLYLSMIFLLVLAIILNIINYNYFLNLLSVTWYIATILIIYSTFKYSKKFKFIQFNIKKMIRAIKSKSRNNLSPLTSLSISLAAKIGVGSLSGVAICLYFGGLGSIFWLMIFSMLVSINTYVECILGIKYRESNGNNFMGGPSYYIKKRLGNGKLGMLYSILIIITYSGLFLSIQSNTIVNALSYFNINSILVVILLFIGVFITISRGVLGIGIVNSRLVPIMLIFYMLIGGYIFIVNIELLPGIFIKMFKEVLNIKTIVPVILVGIQRAIFITESSIGTSAISASTCDNNEQMQGMLEVLGIHITTFIVCFTTFLIVVTSNYLQVDFNNINGIEIVMYAFNYHFGAIGGLLLAIITVLFAFSTIISSYFFGENNLRVISKNKHIKIIFKIVFMIVLVVSCYMKANFLWNLTDYLIAILVIINVSSIIRIMNKEK